jgi:hypothetical protein
MYPKLLDESFDQSNYIFDPAPPPEMNDTATSYLRFDIKELYSLVCRQEQEQIKGPLRYIQRLQLCSWVGETTVELKVRQYQHQRDGSNNDFHLMIFEEFNGAKAALKALESEALLARFKNHMSLPDSMFLLYCIKL